MAQTRPLFVYFSQYNDKYSAKYDYKSVDGVVGNQTRDQWLMGADGSTEL